MQKNDAAIADRVQGTLLNDLRSRLRIISRIIAV